MRRKSQFSLFLYFFSRHLHIFNNYIITKLNYTLIVILETSQKKSYIRQIISTSSLRPCRNSIHLSSLIITSIYRYTTSRTPIFEQLPPPPLIICGDFNAHRNNRGNAVENLLRNDPNILKMNTRKTPAYFSLTSGSFSMLRFPRHFLSWKTHSDLCDSNHLPIYL